MCIVTSSLLLLLVTSSIQADINVNDYVYWTKADISAWHQYFPSRLLEQERLTNLRAIETVTALEDEMETSLAATVRYQAQELETAQFMMEGTSAQGCVKGISSYMDKAVAAGVSYYQDCAADVIPSLERLYASWAKTNNSYQTNFHRALVGIDNCVRTYPNRNSWDRLKTCVDSWSKNYFTVANTTTRDLYVSPAMGKFTNTVAGCAQIAVSGVVDKGWKFLSMLVQCARLSENVDSVMYEQQLTSEFYKYITLNDLMMQVWESQMDNERQVRAIEEEMIHYYNVQKSALEKYVIESRNQSYYYVLMKQYIQKYLNAVSSASMDNPASTDCVNDANSALYTILNKGAVKALECDFETVNNTKHLITQVNDNFLQINSILPYTGNVAIISCFSEGYIFAEKTISNCYSLTLNSFKINITELNAEIAYDVKALQEYETSFFSNSSLPCGSSILSRAILEADKTLYNLQRCLYISMGAKYAVTTSAPFTTEAGTTALPLITGSTENPSATLTTQTGPTLGASFYVPP